MICVQCVNSEEHAVMTPKDVFLNPATPAQRRYEALRARYVDGADCRTAAEAFGYSVAGFRNLCSAFMANPDWSFFQPPTIRPRPRQRRRSRQGQQHPTMGKGNDPQPRAVPAADAGSVPGRGPSAAPAPTAGASGHRTRDGERTMGTAQWERERFRRKSGKPPKSRRFKSPLTLTYGTNFPGRRGTSITRSQRTKPYGVFLTRQADEIPLTDQEAVHSMMSAHVKDERPLQGRGVPAGDTYARQEGLHRQP